METFKKISLVILLLLLVPFSLAQANPDHILSNSGDWRDVYSTVMYANLLDVPNNFLTSTRHSTLILYAIPESKERLQVVTGRDNPLIVGYEDILKSRGYEEAEELIYDNVNLELAKLLPDIHRFIIVDDSYGYNALSAAPYAQAAGYYVLFADELNIDEISDFLSGRGVDELILFGQVDREVRQELSIYNPEIINVGDRFDNNMEMVKKYLTVSQTRQAILTNGEFIESGIMTGADPVIFIGRVNVPDKVRTFIQESDLDVGILIGNELIGAATFIRRQIGISVFVKFAQGARTPTGPVAEVEDLDRFVMPRFEVRLSISSIVYNRATGQLEVTYSNDGDIAAYLKGTITVNAEDGTTLVLGDDAPIFIDGGDLKTVTYQADIPEGGANASVFSIYGEAPQSLENTLEGTLEIEFVEVNDESAIQILGLYYDSKSGKFYVEIENVGPVTAFVDVELIDLIINEERVTVGGDEIIELKPGEKAMVPVSIELAEEDMADNPTIKVQARYGERKLALIKLAQGEFEFEEKKGDLWFYILIGVIVILLLLILFKRKKKCPQCKKGMSGDVCKHCGYRKGGHSHYRPHQSHSSGQHSHHGSHHKGGDGSHSNNHHNR